MEKLSYLKISFVFTFLFNGTLWGQSFQMINRLPKVIDESSGIEETGSNQIWTFNDSGGGAVLYMLDTLGQLLKSVTVSNAWNRDWEDMAKDDNGNFYVGNIGNNRNDNKDLSIFIIPAPEKAVSSITASQLIVYSFEDQTSFPPSKNKMNFDCEGMFWYNQYLYLFSKNRSLPAATNLYKIPAKEGYHEAKKIGTLSLRQENVVVGGSSDFWITAADISPNGKKVALISGKQLLILYDYPEGDFLNGKKKFYSLGSSTQKEAICFVTNDEVYITDEYWKDTDKGGQLYRFRIEL